MSDVFLIATVARTPATAKCITAAADATAATNLDDIAL